MIEGIDEGQDLAHDEWLSGLERLRNLPLPEEFTLAEISPMHGDRYWNMETQTLLSSSEQTSSTSQSFDCNFITEYAGNSTEFLSNGSPVINVNQSSITTISSGIDATAIWPMLPFCSCIPHQHCCGLQTQACSSTSCFTISPISHRPLTREYYRSNSSSNANTDDDSGDVSDSEDSEFSVHFQNQLLMMRNQIYRSSRRSIDQIEDFIEDDIDMPSRRKASQESRRILLTWLVLHRHNPYPTRTQKQELATQTRMTVKQVVHWMSNIRKRRFLPLLSGKRLPTSKVDIKFLEELENIRRQLCTIVR